MADLATLGISSSSPDELKRRQIIEEINQLIEENVCIYQNYESYTTAVQFYINRGEAAAFDKLQAIASSSPEEQDKLAKAVTDLARKAKEKIRRLAVEIEKDTYSTLWYLKEDIEKLPALDDDLIAGAHFIIDICRKKIAKFRDLIVSRPLLIVEENGKLASSQETRSLNDILNEAKLKCETQPPDPSWGGNCLALTLHDTIAGLFTANVSAPISSGNFIIAVISRKTENEIATIEITDSDFEKAINVAKLGNFANWRRLKIEMPGQVPFSRCWFAECDEAHDRVLLSFGNDIGILSIPLSIAVAKGPTSEAASSSIQANYFVQPRADCFRKRCYYGMACDPLKNVVYCCSASTQCDISVWSLSEKDPYNNESALELQDLRICRNIRHSSFSPMTCALSSTIITSACRKKRLMAVADPHVSKTIYLVALKDDGKVDLPMFWLAPYDFEPEFVPIGLKFDCFNNLLFTCLGNRGLEILKVDLTGDLPNSLTNPVERVATSQNTRDGRCLAILTPNNGNNNKNGSCVLVLVGLGRGGIAAIRISYENWQQFVRSDTIGYEKTTGCLEKIRNLIGKLRGTRRLCYASPLSSVGNKTFLLHQSSNSTKNDDVYKLLRKIK